jgi:phosphatidylglycerol:prolipoprotein diacylglycerol transferase
MLTFLAAYLHAIDPYAVMLWEGGPVRWYGLSYLLGFFVAYLLVRRVARVGRSTLQPQHAGDLVMAMAFGIVVGGRVGYVVFYRPDLLWTFSDSLPYWDLLAINKGGMASHGGMIGAVLAGWLYARYSRHGTHDPLHILDLAVFAGPLGVFFGRIANFINGELIGRPCSPSLPWAVKFPQEMSHWTNAQLAQLRPLAGVMPNANLHLDIRYQLGLIIDQVQAGNARVIGLVEPLLTPRHPSQIYQALLEGLLLFVLLAAVWAKPRKPGVIGGLFCLLYAGLRIVGEQFRQPDAHIGFQWLGMTRGQWLSIGLLLAGVALLVTATRRKLKPLGGWRMA